MKVRTKSISLDQLSLEEGTRTIHVFTHRQEIRVSATDGDEEWRADLTFSQFHALIRQLESVEGK